MLEMIHEYARERLEAGEEAEDLHRRHAAYFLALAEQATPELLGLKHVYWLTRLRDEHNNMRTALAWSLGGGDVELGLRLVGALRDFWYYGGHSAEGLAWARQALESARDAAQDVRARALNAAGRLSFDQGDHEHGKVYNREALKLYREMGDQTGSAWTLIYLAAHALGSPGESQEGIALCEEGLELFRILDDQAGISMALNGLGELARLDGDYERASKSYHKAIDIARGAGNQLYETIALGNLGYIAHQQGDYAQAEAILLQAMTNLLELENTRYLPQGLAMLAGPVAAQGYLEKAVRLLGASEALLESMGIMLQAGDQFEVERYVSAIQEQLDKKTFEAAWAEGRAMSLEQAISYAFEVRQPKPAAYPPEETQ
jgi:tetratricopeptide (TPR) repeat protein